MSFFTKITTLRKIRTDYYELIMFEAAKDQIHKVLLSFKDKTFNSYHASFDLLIFKGNLFIENTPNSFWTNIYIEVRFKKNSIDFGKLKPTDIIDRSAYIYLPPQII